MSRKRWSVGSAKKRKLYAAIRKRHGDNCHWCGSPMLFDTREGPLAATIEHLVPRANGGSNKQPNLRLAHRRCNEDRSEPTPRRCYSPFYVLAHLTAPAEDDC